MQLKDNVYEESCRDVLFAKNSSLVFFQLTIQRHLKKLPMKWGCTCPYGYAKVMYVRAHDLEDKFPATDTKPPTESGR